MLPRASTNLLEVEGPVQLYLTIAVLRASRFAKVGSGCDARIRVCKLAMDPCRTNFNYTSDVPSGLHRQPLFHRPKPISSVFRFCGVLLTTIMGFE
jgi:hypothetical protein